MDHDGTSISAAEWVARSGVDPGVVARWPGYQAILLATDDAAPSTLAAVTDELFATAHDFARSLGPDPAPHVAQWHDAYRDFGVKPRVARVSVDALVRRAAGEHGLPRINTLVDLYNALSVLCLVPIGGEDLERYRGPPRLVLAAGDEPFHTTANGEPVVEHPEAGEPIWVDDEGVTCRRWNWRQTGRTAIDSSTRRVGFIIDSLDAPGHEGAQQVAARLADLLSGAVTRTL